MTVTRVKTKKTPDKVHGADTATEVHGANTVTEVDEVNTAAHGGSHRMHKSGSVR